MNEPRTDAPVSEKPTGMAINLGDFTRTQGLMKSLRFMLDNTVRRRSPDFAEPGRIM